MLEPRALSELSALLEEIADSIDRVEFVPLILPLDTGKVVRGRVVKKRNRFATEVLIYCMEDAREKEN